MEVERKGIDLSTGGRYTSKEEKQMERRFARRDFLKASGLSLAGAGLTMVLRPAGAWAIQGSQGVLSFLDQTGTNATYYNDASFNAADPYVLHDEGSGYYYAYSTDGGGQDASGRSYYHGIYRSADLVTWEHRKQPRRRPDLLRSPRPPERDGRPTQAVHRATVHAGDRAGRERQPHARRGSDDGRQARALRRRALLHERVEDHDQTWHVRWQVRSTSGARLALANPLNRVTASLDPPGTITPDADGQGATVTLGGQEATRLTLTYQRRKASGAYEDVYNVVRTPSGAQRRVLVSEIMSLTRDGQSKTSAQTS